MEREKTSCRAWLVVLSLNITFTLYGGLNKVFGVLMPELREQLATDTWLLGWVITMIGASVQSAGLLTGPLTSIFSERAIFTASAVSSVAGLLGAFLAPGLLSLTLCVVCLTGAGLGIIVCLAKALLGAYFSSRLSMAAGISTTGLPLSYMIFPPLAQFLLEVYGWRGTLLIFSALVAFLIPCGLVMRPRPPSGDKSYKPIPANSSQQTSSSEDGPQLCGCGRLLDVLCEKTDFGLFRNVMMWSHIVTYCLFGFVNNSWVIFMVPYAQTKGFAPFTATSFSIIAGVSSMISNLLQGVVVSRHILCTRVLIAIGSAIGSASLVVSPLLHTYAPLAVAMSLYGVSHGILYPGLVCFVIEEQGKSRAANAFGWTGFLSGLFRLCFGFSTGLLYDYTGSYDHTFIFLGTLLGIMVPFFFLDKISDCCSRRKE